MPQDNDPEQLLDAFRAAALSVTKLYKTSASAQTKARQDGYQECLDDLLSFLDREDLGEGAARRVRRWASERRAGSGDAMVQDKESEDEVEKDSDPEKSHDRTETPAATADNATSSTPSAPVSVVPTQEHFTFSSGMSYPDAPNLATLNLSDSTTQPATTPTQTPTQPHAPRARRVGRQSSRTGASLGRGAGQKRRLNFAEIFDLGSLGTGKDMFGGGKRTRHI